MDLTPTDVVNRVLAERKLEPVRVFSGLLRTLVDRHARARAKIPPGDITLPPPTLLEHLIVMLQQDHAENVKIHDELVRDDEPDDEAYVTGLVQGDLANMQSVMLEILGGCWTLAQQEAGVRDDEDEHPPMRLVTD